MKCEGPGIGSREDLGFGRIGQDAPRRLPGQLAPQRPVRFVPRNFSLQFLGQPHIGLMHLADGVEPELMKLRVLAIGSGSNIFTNRFIDVALTELGITPAGPMPNSTVKVSERDTPVTANFQTMRSLQTDTGCTAAEHLVEAAGRVCLHELRSNRAPEECELYRPLSSRSVTFGFGARGLEFAVHRGVAARSTHELIRHRAGWGYSQLSQRYVDESGW